MLLLHGGLESDRFLLWGEQPIDAAPVKNQRRRKSSAKRGNPFPYDAGAEALHNALKASGLDTSNYELTTAPATVWLPSIDGQPVASSPLIAEQPETNESARISPWCVTALDLPIGLAVDLLAMCVGKETLASGIVVSKDLTFLSTVLRFAGSLIARQQFLPSMDIVGEEEKIGVGYWEPILTGADTQKLGQLAYAMPQVCRALTDISSSGSPDTPASRLLYMFIGQVVDHVVRSNGLSVSPAIAKSRQKKETKFDNIHDQWLAALRSQSGVMFGDEAKLTHLSQQMREWQRPIFVSTAAPFNLCFRLEEPLAPDTIQIGNGNGSPKSDSKRSKADSGLSVWQVRYLLQAVDDPSLLLPVEQVWNARGEQAKLLKKDSFKPREYLLSALGRASAIIPQIEASLKSSAPAGYDLDPSGAMDFLQQKAWLLEQSGFPVLLPAWWTRKGTKLRLTARARVNSPKMKTKAGLSLDNIVEVDWEIALGDQKLTLAELETLARLKSPLVKLRGQWVQLNAEEIEAALNFWKNRSIDTLKGRDVMHMAMGAPTMPGGLDFGGVDASGWMGDLLSQLQGRSTFAETEPPKEFRGQLRPYQIRGYSWLRFLQKWGLGACLADDMGLGKTPQTLALIQSNWTETEPPTLVVCPMSVVGNWQKEAERFTPGLSVMVHHGLTRMKGSGFKKEAQKHAIVLSSYSLLHRDFEIFKEIEWASVILDEAQNIKNPETKQAKAARALSAEYRIALTGTPVENNVGDLWSIMEFLNPGWLSTQADFKRNFYMPIQANHDPEAASRLKQLTGPFILRRLKTDKSIIADLPDKMEMKVFCNLTKEQASLYAAVAEEASESLDDFEGIQRKGVVLATISKLKQICNHPAQFLGDNSSIAGRSGKLTRLTEMLEEVNSEGDRALIFTQFAEMGEIIRRHLQETFGREVLFLHGSIPKKQRDSMVARFQGENDGPRIFILSLKAGGTGLNLTAANHVFHFDRWWNPAVENQATDRAFRIGQRKNVQVHKFLCAGTLEEKIDEMIERKHELAEKIVGAGEAWLTELSTEALKDLFALRPEAISE